MDRAPDIDRALLVAWPLPELQADDDKEARGRCLIVAGSREMPGAALLAGTAALRAGAGKVQIGCADSVAGLVGCALPEARVIGLPESPAGGLRAEGAERLAELVERCHALLLGPGLIEEDETLAFVGALLRRVRAPTRVLLDALALPAVREAPSGLRPLLTPHGGELTHLESEAGATTSEDDAVERRARAAAARFRAVVALKGACTVVATPEGAAWRHDGGGHPGLGTAGSGDVLAGLVAGLAARGATLEQAAAFGVWLHAQAGRRCAERNGPLGFLARELSAELPPLLASLA